MTDPPATPPAHSADEAERVARSYLLAFARGDADAIAAHVTDDFVNVHTAGLGAGCEGRATYRERLPVFLSDMRDLRYDIDDLVVDDGRVAVFYTMTASWRGTTPIRIRGAQRLVVRDGLIAHRTDYWDSAVFLAQADPAAKEALASFGLR